MSLDVERFRAALAQERTAFHCDTEEKAEQTIRAVASIWYGNVYRNAYRWEVHGRDTCLIFREKERAARHFTYGALDFLREIGYTILYLDDFLIPGETREATRSDLPCWTEADIADAKAVKRLFPDMLWVARDNYMRVRLYRDKPTRFHGYFVSESPTWALDTPPFESVTWENSPIKLEDIV